MMKQIVVWVSYSNGHLQTQLKNDVPLLFESREAAEAGGFTGIEATLTIIAPPEVTE
jgi:hypothetical protein